MRRFTAIIMGVLVALVGAELVAGRYSPAMAVIAENIRPTVNHDLGYELIPYGRDTLNIAAFNAEGWRDFNYPPASDGSGRIVVLGDSIPYGLGVRVWETYPKILETLTHSEVRNFGVVGYNIKQTVAVYEAKAVDLNPDLVIVTYCLNDPDLNSHQAGAESATQRWLLGKSRVFRLFYARRGVADRRDTGDWYDHITAKHWPTVVEQLKLIKRQTAARGDRLLLAIVPVFDDLANYHHRNIHDRLAAVAREAGIETIDLYPIFHNKQGDFRISPNDVLHPNQAGHRLIAREISRQISGRESAMTDDELIARLKQRAVSEDMGLTEMGLRAMLLGHNPCQAIAAFDAALAIKPDNRAARQGLAEAQQSCH